MSAPSSALIAPDHAASFLDGSPLHIALFDPVALAIVLAGTLLATLARTGAGDARVALRSLALLARPRFDANANRTAIARWASAIRVRGVLGADAAMPPDPALAQAVSSLVRSGSITALRGSHEAARGQILSESRRAVRVFEQAGDLAPVFGLVGTLFSMTRLAPAQGAEALAVASPIASQMALGAIATAVLSTLYGVLAAHFLFLPLAHAVARRAEREDEARTALVEWLADEIADAVPGADLSRTPPSPTVTPLRKVA